MENYRAKGLEKRNTLIGNSVTMPLAAVRPCLVRPNLGGLKEPLYYGEYGDA